MKKLFIEDLDVRGKRVLVRVDFNVPQDEKTGKITDDRRIRESLPTIQWLMEHGARTVLMSHLGRPKGKKKPEFSLKPVAECLSKLLGKPVPLAPDCVGPDVEKQAAALENGGVLLLENLRFHDEEEKNEQGFVDQLARLGDVFVNDAFGTAHRAHASTEGVAKKMCQRAAGYLMKKELDYLDGAVDNPKRPFVAVIGGAKISGKIDVVDNLLKKVDTLLVGGGMIFTFYKAMGLGIGQSLIEEDKVPLAKKILEEMKGGSRAKLLLPVDCVVADTFDNNAKTQVVDVARIPPEWRGLDIGPKTQQLFADTIRTAKTVVWNGPMGVFEMPNFAKGTEAVAKALVDCTKAGGTTVVGGGDSAAAIAQMGLDTKVSHVSTGGGASLEFLEGKVLPGVAVLTDK